MARPTTTRVLTHPMSTRTHSNDTNDAAMQTDTDVLPTYAPNSPVDTPHRLPLSRPLDGQPHTGGEECTIWPMRRGAEDAVSRSENPLGVDTGGLAQLRARGRRLTLWCEVRKAVAILAGSQREFIKWLDLSLHALQYYDNVQLTDAITHTYQSTATYARRLE
eukprot:3798840-Pyramimonas_sp.AAC.1